MRIGLFFGTFNPIHNGHLMMANYIINNTDIDEVSLVINPTAPFKKNDNLLSFDERLKLVKLAVQNTYPYIRPSTIEDKLPKPCYTYNTLRELRNEHGEINEYCLIIGADNLSKLPKWKNSKEIIENYDIYVCPRNGLSCDEEIDYINSNFNVKGLHIVNGVPECDLSSTFIRNQIKEGKTISYYVPDSVAQNIENNKYYK